MIPINLNLAKSRFGKRSVYFGYSKNGHDATVLHSQNNSIQNLAFYRRNHRFYASKCGFKVHKIEEPKDDFRIYLPGKVI